MDVKTSRKVATGAAAVLLGGAITTGVVVSQNNERTLSFGAPNTASWSAKCGSTGQAAAIDPIVYPGVNPTEHLHQFFGAGPVTPNTRPAGLLAGTKKCVTSVHDPNAKAVELPDKTAYWFPSVYTTPAKATLVQPAYLIAYYRNASKDPALIRPWPADLGMVGGNHDGALSFLCIAGNDFQTTPRSTFPDSCPIHNTASPSKPYQLKVSVEFPDCIGPNAHAPDYTPGMVFAGPAGPLAKWQRVCPPGWKPIPQVQLEARWNLQKFPIVNGAYDLRGATLSSDDSMLGRHGATGHADFLNGWAAADLAKLVTNCFNNAQINCGAFGHGNQ